MLEEGYTRRKKKQMDIPGKLVQYTTIQGGYIASTTTVPTLPSDAYTIDLTPDNKIIFKQQNLVTDNLIELPDSKSEEVIKEIKEFWTLKDKFAQYGFSHKRGFLLHGPPGSGKTSTLSLVMKDMISRNGIVFLAGYPGHIISALKDFREVEPERQLCVVWEDLDEIIKEYGEAQVLSVLDGETQVENVIFMATTNYPESLDGRIANRPSRFDKVVEIGLPNKEAREKFLNIKLGFTSVEEDGKKIDLIKETEGFSIAHIKELVVGSFCQNRKISEVLLRLKKMKNTPKSKSNKMPIGLGDRDE